MVTEYNNIKSVVLNLKYPETLIDLTISRFNRLLLDDSAEDIDIDQSSMYENSA